MWSAKLGVEVVLVGVVDVLLLLLFLLTCLQDGLTFANLCGSEGGGGGGR